MQVCLASPPGLYYRAFESLGDADTANLPLYMHLPWSCGGQQPNSGIEAPTAAFHDARLAT